MPNETPKNANPNLTNVQGAFLGHADTHVKTSQKIITALDGKLQEIFKSNQVYKGLHTEQSQLAGVVPAPVSSPSEKVARKVEEVITTVGKYNQNLKKGLAQLDFQTGVVNNEKEAEIYVKKIEGNLKTLAKQNTDLKHLHTEVTKAAFVSGELPTAISLAKKTKDKLDQELQRLQAQNKELRTEIKSMKQENKLAEAKSLGTNRL